MAVFLRIDIDLFAALYLAIVLALASRRLDREDAFNRLFLKGSLFVLILTLFEAATCVLNHNPAPWATWLAKVLHVFLFAFTPLMTCYWYQLANTFTRYGNVRDMHVKWPLLIPVGVVGVITLLSPFLGLVFHIDAGGTYHRGVLYPLVLVVSYGYLLWGFAIILKRRKKITPLDFRFLTLFCLMPMLGGLVQGLVYGTLLMWPGSVFALAILYMYLQERMVQTDYLTGAWTRPSFEYYLTQRLRAPQREPFGVVYVDIDNLKRINDNYGHQEGDAAIRAATAAIKSVLRKGDAVARLGGDEFCILLNLSDRSSLNAVAGRITGAIARYNADGEKPYQLSLSLGVELFADGQADTVEDVITRVDALMYAQKRAKKECDNMPAQPQPERAQGVENP